MRAQIRQMGRTREMPQLPKKGISNLLSDSPILSTATRRPIVRIRGSKSRLWPHQPVCDYLFRELQSAAAGQNRSVEVSSELPAPIFSESRPFLSRALLLFLQGGTARECGAFWINGAG